MSMWALAADGERQGVLFFVTVYTFVVGGYSFVRQMLARRWPSVKGDLLDAGIKAVGGHDPRDSDQDYKASSSYRYVVDGQVFEGSRVSVWVVVTSRNARFLLQRQLDKIQRDANGRVDVFYNPRRPDKSFLLRPGWFGVLVTLGIAVVPIILYLRAFPV